MKCNVAARIAACRSAMTQLFDGATQDPLNVLRFQSAGSVQAVPAGMPAQQWLDQALAGVTLKPAYAGIPVSGLLLLRDTLMGASTAGH